jgi:hypothetical protein
MTIYGITGRIGMRATDHRYAAEMAKFHLAVRMIGHEARTGTIRTCTGFSEDRIRKIYATYFKAGQGPTVRRRRGKSPRQIAPYVSSSQQQAEATVLACMFVYCGVMLLAADDGAVTPLNLTPLTLGNRLCDSYETYRQVYPDPGLCFEKTWGLYKALVQDGELFFAYCGECGGPYVQDRYALDYSHCPFCDLKQLCDRTADA